MIVPNKNFNWRKFDAYLFDIDGTLLNSRDGVHYESFHAGLRRAWNCSIKIDNVPVHGNTDVGILRAAAALALVDDSSFLAGLPVAVEEMCSEVERHRDKLQLAVCPAIPRLLKELSSAGKMLAVASGNLEPIGWAKLRAAGIADFFTFGSFSGERESRVDIFRWGAEKISSILGTHSSTCVVGDTPSDIAAAREVGLPIIAVATGTYSFDALAALKPDRCLQSCDKLWP